MEPMALGSPAGSPSQGTSNYLPSYLLGESNISAAPRSNTLSPTKGRSLAFSPTSPVSPTNEFNRSILQQRSVFGYPQSPPQNFTNTSQVNHNVSVSGPPTQGLFDSLRNEKNSVGEGQSNTYNQMSSRQMNQSINQSISDAYLLSQSDFNSTRLISPNQLGTSYDFRTSSIPTPLNNCMSPLARPTNFWITVFGFPNTATPMILSHFSQCGTIVDKKFAPQSGNWIHLRFASGFECEKALNYHERIIGNNLMIGVTYCKDPSIVDKENLERSQNLTINRVRPLAQVAYRAAQSPNDVSASPITPIRSTGIVNKAMDLFFGW